MIHSRLEKIVAGTLIAIIVAIGAPISVPRAEAAAPVGVPTAAIADLPRVLERAAVLALQHAALAAAKAAIQSVARSTVNWIRSGFHGSPGFETNLGVNLQALEDGVVNDFLHNLESDTTINSPWLAEDIAIARDAYYLYSSRDQIVHQLQFTLDRYANDPRAFIRGDYNQGGVNAWLATTWGCGNDPYCSQFAIQQQLVSNVSSQVEQRLREYDAGRGFLSWRCDCDNAEANGWGPTNLSNTDTTYSCQICTPGSTIADNISFLQNQPELQLTVAESIDQVLSALASQLISQAIGGISGGLLGSGGTSNTGGRPGTTGTVGGDVAATLGAGFLQAAQDQRANVATYQTNWSAIRSAASSASQACAAGNPAIAADVAVILNQGDAALRKSADALAALDSIIARAQQLQNATSSPSVVVNQVTNDYNCFLQCGDPRSGTCVMNTTSSIVGTTCPVTPAIMPSTSEMNCVGTESVDSPGPPPTLLNLMNQITASSCT